FHLALCVPSLACTPVFFLPKLTDSSVFSTLSLHDALPISGVRSAGPPRLRVDRGDPELARVAGAAGVHQPALVRAGQHLGHGQRSEEHTSELQSRENLVCRPLLETKKKTERTSTKRRNSPT